MREALRERARARRRARGGEGDAAGKAHLRRKACSQRWARSRRVRRWCPCLWSRRSCLVSNRFLPARETIGRWTPCGGAASDGSSEAHLNGRPRASLVHPYPGLISLPVLCAAAPARLWPTRQNSLPAARLGCPPRGPSACRREAAARGAPQLGRTAGRVESMGQSLDEPVPRTLPRRRSQTLSLRALLARLGTCPQQGSPHAHVRPTRPFCVISC